MMMGCKPRKQTALTRVLLVIYLVVLAWLVLFKLQFSIPVIEEGRVFNLIPFLGSFYENGAIRFGEIRNNIVAWIRII